MTPLVTGLVVSGLCLGVFGFMCWRAPLGFEDDTRGFVEGDEHADEQNLGI